MVEGVDLSQVDALNVVIVKDKPLLCLVQLCDFFCLASCCGTTRFVVVEWCNIVCWCWQKRPTIEAKETLSGATLSVGVGVWYKHCLLLLCVRVRACTLVWCALFRSWHVISRTQTCMQHIMFRLLFSSMDDLFVDLYQRHVMSVIHPAAQCRRATGK